MKAVDLLPSRASAPEHCRECDGPRDQAGPDCSECAGAGLAQRLEWRYQNGEGIARVYTGHGVVIEREFHPLHGALALEFRLGDEHYLSVSFAVWTIAIRRDL